MRKIVKLRSGCYIEFSSKSVRFYSKDKEELSEIRSRSSVVRILEELLRTPGRNVDYEVLYTATRKVNKGEIKKTHEQAVCGAINTLHEDIKVDIINKRNVGFKIMLANDAEPYYRTHGELQDICGEYFAFYLDPAIEDGQGKIMTALIHIYPDMSRETKMAVSTVLRIQDIGILKKMATELPFGSNSFAHFDEYCSKLDKQHRDCFLVNGEVKDCGQNVVALTLHNKSATDETIDRWNIVLNLKDYMVDDRQRTSSDDMYRGGTGMLIGGWTKWGIIAGQIVLIRKPQNSKNVKFISSDDIMGFLTTPNHVCVNESIDKKFYIWLMKHWPVSIDSNTETE